MTSQPIPNVTDDDVRRVVTREFPADSVKGILQILHQYGADRSDDEAARVRLAALKLAAGNVKRLRSAIETAKQDFRDVLAIAEYPEYFRSVGGPGRLSEQETQRIIDSDWQQYNDWLTRK